MEIGKELRAWLPAGGFGEVLYAFASLDSTNAFAARLAQEGAGAGTLVVADHQRLGRGRGGSHWLTPAGSAIALSVVLRPDKAYPLRWTGLGALAVAEALRQEGLAPAIKWPNDVLLGGRKVAGVLAEASWVGDRLAYVVLGLGVNVGPGSVPKGRLAFPATCVEEHAARKISRCSLISTIVRALESWHAQLTSTAFRETWEGLLAFRGERVRVQVGGGTVEGRLLGLSPEGEAQVLDDRGTLVLCGGEAQGMRPVDRPPE